MRSDSLFQRTLLEIRYSIALSERLLWALTEDPVGVRIDGDPLLLETLAGLLQRQLGEMKTNSRTGEAVARLLRERARQT